MKSFKHLMVLIGVTAVVTLPTSVRAADDDGTATATIVVPITITATQDLAFGRINAVAAGTVTVDTSGNRTGTGVVLVSSGNVTTEAKFTVGGLANATYAITLPAAAATITEIALGVECRTHTYQEHRRVFTD